METTNVTKQTSYPTALDLALDSRPVGASKQAILALFTGQWYIHNYGDIEYLTTSHYSRITGDRLRNRIMSGTITAVQPSGRNITYAVIYHRTTPELCFRAELVSCSYRETKLGNFVLVRPVVRPVQAAGVADKVADNNKESNHGNN